jgi:asparagine synthase (glutamine-hydrolysing)
LTEGDTEVLAHAIDEWGEDALPRLEGMFAVAWTVDGDPTLRAARDRFGEMPLHLSRSPAASASEIKGLLAIGARGIADVPPSTVVSLSADGTASARRWYRPAPSEFRGGPEAASARLRAELEIAADHRSMSDVPAGVLVSGGIDSSTVAALMAERMPLIAFTAVFDRKSRDLALARATCEAIGLRLVEVSVPAPSADDAAEVVRAIEMPHKAQVEIGWACLHLAREMNRRGIKVVFSGEGSDELWASYGFAYHGLKRKSWFDYRRDLFLDQARKNFPRCNKAFMTAGIECRLPFLSTGVVEAALSFPRAIVQDGSSRPKAVLERAAADLVLPEIRRRSKVAFQDGMGIKKEFGRAVARPIQFYRAEHARLMSGNYSAR